ncbi:MAG: ABC transporter permease [Candidatus Poseidoniaceae archaeon]
MVDSTNLWDVVVRTLVTSGSATVLAGGLALGLAMVLANSEWKGKPILRGITQALYGLPPVVVGVAVYIALSKDGVFGSLNWLFTIQGMIVAQTLLIFPLILGVSWTALERVSSEKRDVFRVMNASPKQRIFLEMYCARRGITNAILLGFGRAIAEVGAVLMVGGNIAGKTRVLTTSVVLETSVGRLDVALQLGFILLVISLVTAFSLQLVQYVRLFERRVLGSELFNEMPIDSFSVSWNDLKVEKSGKKIVDSCSVELFSNEIVALMGESGSGKSTLLRAICGLENEPNPSASDIAYVSQNPVLVMDTVAMELELPSTLHNELPNAGQYFASLCGFEEKGDQRTDSLSGGEIQRLAFLRALSMNRKILVLDEVTSELDGASIERIENQIISFKERGGSVLLATHNPQQAKRLADRILYIHKGRLIADDHEVAEQLRSGQRIG